MSYKIIGIPENIAQKVRETMKSPQYGHPAFSEIARGYGPCRLCLKIFDEGNEERILFTYNAFEGLSSLPLPSPIFVHKDKCERFEAGEFPKDLRNLPIALEGFGKESWLILREKVDERNIETQIKQIFESVNVEYIHLRNTEAGCFIARVERGD